MYPESTTHWLKSPTRYSAILFCIVHENLVSFIYEFGLQRILAPTWKPEEIWLWIFLWSCEFIHYIADLIEFLYIFQFSLRSTYIYLTKKRVNYLGYSIWMKQKNFFNINININKNIIFLNIYYIDQIKVSTGK